MSLDASSRNLALHIDLTISPPLRRLCLLCHSSLDMDGTLIDSTPGVLATWEVYGREHGLDLQEVLRTSHGIRTEDK